MDNGCLFSLLNLLYSIADENKQNKKIIIHSIYIDKHLSSNLQIARTLAGL